MNLLHLYTTIQKSEPNLLVHIHSFLFSKLHGTHNSFKQNVLAGKVLEVPLLYCKELSIYATLSAAMTGCFRVGFSMVVVVDIPL